MSLYSVADESFSYTGPASLVAAGYRGMIGYASPDPAKNLTVARIDQLHQAGLMVGAVAEGTGKELATPGAGRALAQRLLPIVSAWGVPAEFLLYWALDEDVSTAQWPVVRDNLGDIGAVTPWRVGCYGGSPMLSWLLAQGVIEKRWVASAYSWSSPWWTPGHFPTLDGAELLQVPGIVFGGAADANSVEQPDWAQWNPDGTIGVTHPTPTPTHLSLEDEMATLIKACKVDANGNVVVPIVDSPTDLRVFLASSTHAIHVSSEPLVAAHVYRCGAAYQPPPAGVPTVTVGGKPVWLVDPKILADLGVPHQ